MSKKILLTGPPGIGKTTIIKKVIDTLQKKGFSVCGFYTEEIRENNKRAGFKIIGLDGSCGTLAHINFKSNYRVGRYFVKLSALEECIAQIPGSGILIIDEIGKMELFSEKFKNFVDRILNEEGIVIATIGEKFVHKFGKNSEVLEVTPNNRNLMPGIIFNKI